MATNVFAIKTGDRLPALAMQLLDDDGEIIDLTPYGSALIVIAPIAGGRRIVVSGEAGILEPATDGKIEYFWGEDETSKAGEYLLEVKLVDMTTGKIRTVPGGRYDKVIILPKL